jgi:S-adenosylmethionine synthetase
MPTSSYGHFGRESYTGLVDVFYEVPGSKPKLVNGNGKQVYQKKVEFFAWEKLDYVEKIKKEFKL